MIPLPYRWAILVALLLGCYGIGYTQAKHAAEVERAKVEAVAIATDKRYRQLETEVTSAQSAYVQSWTAARDKSRADWLRLKASSNSRMPAIPAVCPSAPADPGTGLEGASEPLTAGEAVDAFAAGESLGASLRLCQTELRQCAALR